MRRSVLRALAAVLVVAGGFVAFRVLDRPAVQVGGSTGESGRPSVGYVAHAAWDRLLLKYVDGEGLVGYRRWKASAEDVQALDDYLKHLGEADLRKLAGRAAQAVFWINAYNALTVQGILREYPTTSIRNHTSVLGGYNIWKDLPLWVDDRNYCLDEIEHQILRKMGEPRLHFALVRAAKGCPPLRNRAYQAGAIEEDLTDNARRFFARRANFQADAEHRIVSLSPLLKWYGSDFGRTTSELLRVLRPWFPRPETLAWVEDPATVLDFLEYDWGLNDQDPVGK